MFCRVFATAVGDDEDAEGQQSLRRVTISTSSTTTTTLHDAKMG